MTKIRRRPLVVIAMGMSLVTSLAAFAHAQSAAPSDTAPWPYPIADRGIYANRLFDLLEYQRTSSVSAMHWDFLGWHGSDRRRMVFKSEGVLYPGNGAGGELDAQLLYGRLVTPYFELQTGARLEQHRESADKPLRAFAVLGLQGLSPYRFDIEPVLFLSNKGKISARLTASNDLLVTQRTILQARVETEVAAQSDETFGVRRGFDDLEAGLRLRHEFSREFAPYIGVSYRRAFGITAERVQREGGIANAVQLAAGVRTWF
jgi:copper resistance protein B